MITRVILSLVFAHGPTLVEPTGGRDTSETHKETAQRSREGSRTTEAPKDNAMSSEVAWTSGFSCKRPSGPTTHAKL